MVDATASNRGNRGPGRLSECRPNNLYLHLANRPLIVVLLFPTGSALNYLWLSTNSEVRVSRILLLNPLVVANLSGKHIKSLRGTAFLRSSTSNLQFVGPNIGFSSAARMGLRSRTKLT